MTSTAAERFVDALLYDVESAATDADREVAVASIRDLRAAARAKIDAGQGEAAFITTANQNGKMVSRQLGLSCVEMFTLLTEALRSIDGQPSGRLTYADFSQIHEF
jgi:hypothetical protein